MDTEGDVVQDKAAPGGPRGVKSRIFGSALVCLGALNLMLSAKGGLAPKPFDYALILAGALFVLTGVLRGRNRAQGR